MTPSQNIDASGWDKSLVVDWDFQLKELRNQIRDAAPHGKTGTLKQAFGNPKTVTINRKQTEITIAVKPPDPAAQYAGVVNFGSVPHAIHAVVAEALRFFWMGQWWFRKWVWHPGTTGQHYVEEGIINWWNRITRGTRFTVVKWRSGRAGQGLRSR